MAKRIEAVGVSAYYGTFKAIDNVTLTEPEASQPLTLVITLSTYFKGPLTHGV